LRKICAYPAKRREAEPAQNRHNRPVHADLFQRLVFLLPVIKREWEQLLPSEPVLNPLGRPAALTHLMDTTLQQVLATLVSTENQSTDNRTQRAGGPGYVSLHRGCDCGQNPLLGYFSTGELALRCAAAPALGGDWDMVLDAFRSVAKQEIGTLCSLCQLRHAPKPAAAGGARTLG
jgi:hypothetical protein